jgi:hypothetical protein
MSGDKKKSVSSDLEYQYEGESMGEESLEAPQKRPPMLQVLKEKLKERLPKKKSHKILLIIGVAIYVLYKFLDVGTPPPPPSVPATTKINAQQLTKPAPAVQKLAVVEKQPEKPIQKPAAVSAPVENLDVEKASLASTNTSNNIAVEMEQHAEIKELQATLNQMNHSLMALESSLLTLTGSAINLSKKVNSLEQSRQKSEKSAAAPQSLLLVYYLHSLTNERAWLKLPGKGELITVKVGDFLPGYGQVQKIDVYGGVIFTSSGRVVNYGPNDG